MCACLYACMFAHALEHLNAGTHGSLDAPDPTKAEVIGGDKSPDMGGRQQARDFWKSSTHSELLSRLSSLYTHIFMLYFSKEFTILI